MIIDLVSFQLHDLRLMIKLADFYVGRLQKQGQEQEYKNNCVSQEQVRCVGLIYTSEVAIYLPHCLTAIQLLLGWCTVTCSCLCGVSLLVRDVIFSDKGVVGVGAGSWAE